MKHWMKVAASLAVAMGAVQAQAQTQPQSQPSMIHGVTTAVAPISAEILNSPAYAKLIAELKAGGHIIYLRHAQTASTSEKVVGDLADCSWQRNLSDQGQRQARLVGGRLGELAIPVSAVEASPFCRTRQTAELAFGRKPTINPDLFYHATQSLDQVAAANAKLKARFATAPASGGNLVLVGHSPGMREAGAVELPEGQAAIVRPNGDGTFRIVGRLTEAGITPQ